MDINIQNKDKIFHRISVDYNKSLLKILQQKSKQKLDDVEKLDLCVVTPALFNVEMNYLLDNLINPDDVAKVISPEKITVNLTNETVCNFCHTPLKNENQICCSNREIQMYINNVASKKLLNQISSFSIADAEKKSINKRRSLGSSKASIYSGKSLKNLSSCSSINFEKHLGTLMRIKKKMQLIKKFYPEIYNSNESVIDMWTRSDLRCLMEDENDEQYQDEYTFD